MMNWLLRFTAQGTRACVAVRLLVTWENLQ